MPCVRYKWIYIITLPLWVYARYFDGPKQSRTTFAKENPHVALYLKPRRHRSPVFVAEYRKYNVTKAIRGLNKRRNMIDTHRNSSNNGRDKN